MRVSIQWSIYVIDCIVQPAIRNETPKPPYDIRIVSRTQHSSIGLFKESVEVRKYVSMYVCPVSVRELV